MPRQRTVALTEKDDMSRETLQTYLFKCANCEVSFESRNRGQLASSRNGRNVYCSEQCRNVMSRKIEQNRGAGRYTCGPCPTCNNTFLSRTRGKRFCSMVCYTKSEELLLRLSESNAAKAKDWICHQCGQEAPRKRKFCNDFCRRRFYAERFDRFIANPERIALPQNYDEFLNRDELPCLVEGCDWVGVGLGGHVNRTHGIDSDKFREMVGFNASTALMGVAARERRSEIMCSLIEQGIVTPVVVPPASQPKERKPLRLEGREHVMKAMAVNGTLQKLHAASAAYMRSEAGRRMASETVKRTAANMPKVTLVCNECGEQYQTPKNCKFRSKFCSMKCRNKTSNRKWRKIRKQQKAVAANVERGLATEESTPS